MGLAAGQARLLSITARKSDCEFTSMRLSHQKIALTRQLADLSNEYQSSLEHTKLIYDYYGTGDEAMRLSYGILMEPSILNNYSPMLLTDSLSRVILNNKYAAAAAAAGIPQEGFGTLPSESVRNDFIKALAGSSIITNELRDVITSLPYNQAAGVGGGALTLTSTQELTYQELMKKLDEAGAQITVNQADLPKKTGCKNAKGDECNIGVGFQTYNPSTGESLCTRTTGKNGKSEVKEAGDAFTVNLSDLLNGEKQYNLAYEGMRGEQTPVFGIALMQNYLTEPNGFLHNLYEQFANVLNIDDFSQAALDYAYEQISYLVYPKDLSKPSSGTYAELHDEIVDHMSDWGKKVDEGTEWDYGHIKFFASSVGTNYGNSVYSGDMVEDYRPKVVNNSSGTIGFHFVAGNKGSDDDGNDHSTGGINLNNLAKAFLTYFVDYQEGLATKDIYGNEKYYVNMGYTENSKLVNKDSNVTFYAYAGTSVSSDDMAMATYYDSMFNQICQRGWVQNAQVDDPDYVQQMLKSGMMYVTKMKEDNYYYQENYSSDSYIKEIDDESYIAKAEAKYNTEKAKLNAKEETIDLKMKNLDTEISSLTTEYDTVKNTISKNIEKSFKRFNA